MLKERRRKKSSYILQVKSSNPDGSYRGMILGFISQQKANRVRDYNVGQQININQACFFYERLMLLLTAC